MKETCICAAVKDENGKIYRCHRHADGLLAIWHRKIKRDDHEDAEGFITSKGRYVTRGEGRKLQDAAGVDSIWKDGYLGPNLLFSEDLY